MPVRVALVVRVVEALAGLHDDEAGLRDRHVGHAVDGLLLAAIEDAAQVLAVHELERDEVGILDLAEIEDLRDVGVVELDRDLRLVDEHRDELFVLSDVRQDALDGEQTLEALDAEGFRLPNLGHAADVDAVEELVLSELDRLLQPNPRAYNLFCCLAYSGSERSAKLRILEAFFHGG